MSADDRIKRAGLLYERFIFEGDSGALTAAGRELDVVEADLALGRGRVIHGHFLDQRDRGSQRPAEDPRELALFQRAAELYQALGDVRGEAEALFWVGCCQQVVRGDNDAAVPVLERSCELAAEAGDKATLSDAHGAGTAVRPQAPQPVSDSSVPEQIRSLSELHASGILTDDEFSAKKAELLARM